MLRAVGVRDGEIVATQELRTTGAAQGIRLSADKNRIDTSRRDLAHVKVEIIDAVGLLVPTANDQIAFELQGDGTIIGVDNGQPDSHELYRASERRAFNGLALVLVQSSGRAGTMVLSASAPLLAGARIEILAT